MGKIIHAVSLAFKNITKWRTVKLALFGGGLVVIFWIVVGSLLWHPIVGISSKVLELVPFSMVRSNGAWMLSSFLWLQLVLVTFALLFAFLGNFILKEVPKQKYNLYMIITIVFSALFWSVVWLIGGDFIYHKFLQLLTWLPFETVEKGVGALIGFYMIYSAIIATMLFVVSIFSRSLIKEVAKENFPELKLFQKNAFSSFKYTLKDTLIYLVISLLALPLLFVPVLNFLVFIVIWVWLVKDTFCYDSASLLFEHVDLNRIKEHRLAILVISFLTALFNFVPILNLFGPFFGEIALFSYFAENHLHKKGV